MQGSCVPANGRRFTPACAGKSEHGHDDEPDDRESPPRARGRDRSDSGVTPPSGITPACAGKSQWPRPAGPARRNHPRVRGEERWADVQPSSGPWNHPRVRGEESNENAAFEGMDIPPKCNFFVLFRNVLRVPCDSRARGSKAIRLSSIRACYMLCVPNTRADHRGVAYYRTVLFF